MRQHTVFVTSDSSNTEMLNEISRKLTERGIEVIRGPETPRGGKYIFPKELYNILPFQLRQESFCPFLPGIIDNVDKRQNRLNLQLFEEAFG